MNNLYRNQYPREMLRDPMISPGEQPLYYPGEMPGEPVIIPGEQAPYYPIDPRGIMPDTSMPMRPMPGPAMPMRPMPSMPMGSMPGMMEPSGHYMNEELVRTIQDCAATCEHMTRHIKGLQGGGYRERQATLLRECADVCHLTAKYLARGSEFSRQAAAVCAEICEICGNECAKYPDQMSQHCSEVCLNCARHCRNYAGMRR